MRTFEVNRDSDYGDLSQIKAKRNPVLSRPRACHRMGIAGASDLARPLFCFRIARERTNGSEPEFTILRLNQKRGLESATPAPYSAARRALSLFRLSILGGRKESFTP